MLEWVELGESAFGLVLSGRIVALVYWHEADVVESDGRSVMTQAGLSWGADGRALGALLSLRDPGPR
jgi:hypothetical protein